MITQWKTEDKKVEVIKTKQFKTGLFIYLNDGETSASFKEEKQYHLDLRDKLVG